MEHHGLTNKAYYGGYYLRWVHQHGYPIEENRRKTNVLFYNETAPIFMTRGKAVHDVVAYIHSALQRGEIPAFVRDNPDLTTLYKEVLEDFRKKYRSGAVPLQKLDGNVQRLTRDEINPFKQLYGVTVRSDQAEETQFTDSKANITVPRTSNDQEASGATALITERGQIPSEIHIDNGELSQSQQDVSFCGETMTSLLREQKRRSQWLNQSEGETQTKIQRVAEQTENDEELVYMGTTSLLNKSLTNEELERKVIYLEMERDKWQTNYYDNKEKETKLAEENEALKAELAQLKKEYRDVKLQLMEDKIKLMSHLAKEKDRTIILLSEQ